MPTYDVPSRKIYSFNGVNLATAFSRNIRGPFNRRGRVVAFSAQITTSVAGATTLPVVTVTTTQPPIPASPKAATPPAQTVVLSATIPVTTAPMGYTSDSTSTSIVRDANSFVQIVPSNADLVFAVAPATGAGAAGVADFELTVDWF